MDSDNSDGDCNYSAFLRAHDSANSMMLAVHHSECSWLERSGRTEVLPSSPAKYRSPGTDGRKAFMLA